MKKPPRTRDELTEQERIEVMTERAFLEARRKQYLIHLWEVNSPHYPREQCVRIIAPRAGYTYDGARDALKKMGYLPCTKDRKKQ